MDYEEDMFRATVGLYVKDECIATASGTAMDVFYALPNIPNSIYLLEYYTDHIYNRIISEEHFGCKCRKRGGLYLTESMYCNWLMNLCFNDLKKGRLDDFSFDTIVYKGINIALREEYEQKKEGFEEWSQSFFSNGLWRPISKLNEVDNVKGIYALVLDKYKLCYIGQSDNMKRRILNHWGKDNWFTIGIDMYRAKDTTRIYVIDTPKLNQIEYNLVRQVPLQFTLNTLSGGTIDYIFGTGKPLTVGRFDAKHPWYLKYKDFRTIKSKYYDKYLITE